MRNFFIALLLLLGTGVYADAPAYTPEKAFQRLKEGNQRFMTGRQDCIKNYLKELEQSKDKQEPYAAILCCSDSRIPPELIFDESLGKLFIIRVAGNVATDVTIGSIEYAVAQLKVPIVVVLGHEACGVLVAALKGAQKSSSLCKRPCQRDFICSGMMQRKNQAILIPSSIRRSSKMSSSRCRNS